MKLQQLTRVALMLALMIVFQSLRLFIPLPAFMSIFIIGSLVNACLLITLEIGHWRAALIPAIVAPVVAYMQQLLPLPILIVPIALANAAYILGYQVMAERNKILAIGVATVAKFIILYLTVWGLIQYIAIPANIAKMLTMMLGWPQIITGLGGGMIFFAVRKRLLAVSAK